MSRPIPTAPRPLRRAVAVGGLLLIAALAAHAAAGGPLPAVGALVVPAALCVLVAAVLTSGRPPRTTALVLVGASQYAVHALLVLSASRAATGSRATVGAMGADPRCAGLHGHGAVVDCLATAGAAGGAAGAVGAGGAVSSDAAMLALHVAATLATGLLLAQADRLLGWLRAALRPRRRPRTPRVHGVGRPARVTILGSAGAALPPQVWKRVPPRRGPPRGSGVVRLATT